MLKVIFYIVGLRFIMLKFEFEFLGVMFIMIIFIICLIIVWGFVFNNDIVRSSFGFLGLDYLGLGIVMLSSWVFIMMVIARIRYIKGIYGNLYINVIIFLLLILIFRFSSKDFIYFYVFFERSLIPIFIIILGWGYQPERVRAGFYMFFYTLTASLPLLVIFFFIFWIHGSTFMFMVPSYWGGVLMVYCLIFAFLLKLPLYIFHLWLPRAHVEAPVAGSMILAGVLLKLGGYGLIRVFPIIYFF